MSRAVRSHGQVTRFESGAGGVVDLKREATDHRHFATRAEAGGGELSFRVRQPGCPAEVGVVGQLRQHGYKRLVAVHSCPHCTPGLSACRGGLLENHEHNVIRYPAFAMAVKVKEHPLQHRVQIRSIDMLRQARLEIEVLTVVITSLEGTVAVEQDARPWLQAQFLAGGLCSQTERQRRAGIDGLNYVSVGEERQGMAASDDCQRVPVELDKGRRREVFASLAAGATPGGVDRLRYGPQVRFHQRPAAKLAQKDRRQTDCFETLAADVTDDKPNAPRRL